MHIDYQESWEDKIVKAPEVKVEKVPEKGQGIWRFLRLVVVTGLIFGGVFVLMNLGAFTTIAANILNPEKQQEAQAILEKASNSQVDPAKLLPTLPDTPEIQKQYIWPDFPIVATDYRLTIPKLGVNVPVNPVTDENLVGQNWTALEKQIQDELIDGVVHYPQTALPGNYGNVFITGHSSNFPWIKSDFNDIFALLGDLEVGDEFYIDYQGRRHEYVIREKFEVSPSDVSILNQPADERIATLMTCTPVGTNLRRLVLKAEEKNYKSGPKLPELL